uniref:gustatory receptor 60 isoform Gr60a n=1 Tax=Aedes aegypti TaxID=7159 RepID=UPI000C2521F0|nr:gustatory receptor 60 isoform Gr60a [Aedes aegypti]
MCYRAVNIYDSFRPLEVFLKLIGILPLFWVDGSVSVTRFKHKLCNWIQILANYLFIILLAKIILSQPYPPDGDISIKIYASPVMRLIPFVFPLLFMTFNFAMSDHMKRIFRMLNDVDQKIGTFSYATMNYQQHQFKIVAFSFCCFAATLLTACTNLISNDSAYEQCTRFIHTLRVLLTLVAIGNHFVVTLWLVVQRMKQLGNCFRMYFPVNSTPNGFSTSPGYLEMVVCNEKEQLVALRQIKVLHDKLNDVVELVNYCFAVQITFCVGLCFVIGVVCSFGLFKTLLYWDELYYMGLLNFVWYLYYLFFVLFFIAIGSKVTREGKQMGILVHKAINCSTSSVVINELNIFSQQLLHRSPVITCGLFVYDWTLLYTMIGATATYLIILIQFDVSFPSPTSLNDTVPYKG